MSKMYQCRNCDQVSLYFVEPDEDHRQGLCPHCNDLMLPVKGGGGE